jgi:hypothetical protein
MIAAAIGGANDRDLVVRYMWTSSHGNNTIQSPASMLRSSDDHRRMASKGVIAVKVRCAVCGYVSDVVLPEEWVQHPSRIPTLWMCDVCAEEWT